MVVGSDPGVILQQGVKCEELYTNYKEQGGSSYLATIRHTKRQMCVSVCVCGETPVI